MKRISKINKINKINKEILDHTISATIFTILLVGAAIVITFKYIDSSIQKVYVDKGFSIQISPKINKSLDILSDYEGLSEKNNLINITNNNSEDMNYQIILTPLSEDEEDIRVALDKNIIKSLSNFEKKDDYYILIDNILPASVTKVHTITMWQDKRVENKKINVDFKLDVKILN